MALSGLVAALGLAFLCALPDVASAQQYTSMTSFSPSSMGQVYRQSRFESTLIVDVRPLDAQVLLDGHPIGSGRELVAIAVAVEPGWHTVEIVAPGFYSYKSDFAAESHAGTSQFVVTLAPVR
jgi:hypothetical protein